MFAGSRGPGMVFVKTATRQQPYRMPNKVHSVQLRRRIEPLSGVGAAEYYGPLQQGQTWSAYQAFMESAFVKAVTDLFTSLIYGGSSLHQNKPKQQGG